MTYALLGIAVIGIGIGLIASRQNNPAPPAEIVTGSSSSATVKSGPSMTKVAVKKRAPRTAEDFPPAAVEAKAAAAEKATQESTPAVPVGFKLALDALLSPQASYAQKQEAWKQLRDTGKLDQAISELEQRAANNPQAAEYSAVLGQAYLQKCATIQDVREQGILAMKADQVFDAALQLDPANWEARFTKAVAMSYWPPQMNKGQEVIDHFTQLINQQEGQPPQPQFAQTYVWLGDQYQKAGNNDYARAAWQRGAALFPNDSTLPKRLAQPADK